MHPDNKEITNYNLKTNEKTKIRDDLLPADDRIIGTG